MNESYDHRSYEVKQLNIRVTGDTRISDSKWVEPILSKFRITGDSLVRCSSVPPNMKKALIILILTNHRLD